MQIGLETPLIVPSEVHVTDEYAASRFVALMGDHIRSDGGVVHIFDDTTGLWSKSLECIRRKVVEHKEHLRFHQASETNPDSFTLFDYGGVDSNFDRMMGWIGAHCASEHFFSDRAGSSTGKLLFSNGIYDFATNEFNIGFDPSIVFHGRINRPFPKERSVDKMNAVIKALFVDPFDLADMSMSDYLRIGMSRAIFGDFRAKLVWFCVGSGHGELINALEASFESFVGSFDAGEHLQATRNTPHTCGSRNWLLPISSKRLVYSRSLDRVVPINGNTLKLIASGGDTIEVRTSRASNPSVLRCTVFCLVDDIPLINPYDDGVKNRVRVIEYKMGAGIDWSDAGNRDAFVHVILDSYQDYVAVGHTVPTSVHAANDAWTTGSGLCAVLQKHFDITHISTDVATYTEVNEYVSSMKFEMSVHKIEVEMKKNGLVLGKQKTAGCGYVGIWSGIRIKKS